MGICCSTTKGKYQYVVDDVVTKMRVGVKVNVGPVWAETGS